MMTNNRLFWSKTLCALVLGATLAAAHAEPAGTGDEALKHNVEAALHQKAINVGVRVQAIDGVVYLYGRAVNRPNRIDIESAAQEAVPGHKVVSSIVDEPTP